jgi:hypothetical protein
MSTKLQPRRIVRSSELSRNSASVFEAADAGPVEITRRDGESLVLSRASDARRQEEGVGVAASLLAALLPTHDLRTDGLEIPFPWVHFLSADDREAFALELVNVTRACAAVGRFDELILTLASWQSTARALADGLTADPADLGWLDEPIPVSDPHLG